MSTPAFEPQSLWITQDGSGLTDIVRTLDNARQSAIEAVTAGDFNAARRIATQAMLILATIPDGQIGGVASQTWDRSTIEKFLLQLDRLEVASVQEATGLLVAQSYQYTARRDTRC